jgi:hypothetical protein
MVSRATSDPELSKEGREARDLVLHITAGVAVAFHHVFGVEPGLAGTRDVDFRRPTTIPNLPWW